VIGLGLGRFAGLVLAVVLLIFGAAEGVFVWRLAFDNPDVTVAMDLRLYVEHATRWMAGGGFYLPEQMTPYVIEDIFPFPPMYPPVILYLLVPMVWGVPWIAWWLVPAGIIAAAIVTRRPAWWQWPLLALILVLPRTWMILVYGNPALWALAFLAAGMVWGTTPFAALKLTYLPLALIGIGRRKWWLAAGIGLLLAVPFGAMWVDFARAVVNASSSRGAEYVLGEWPIALLLVAGLASRPRWSLGPMRGRIPSAAPDPVR
jgi:hypothetical protein